MKKCPFCGADIADDASFCSECGKQITSAENAENGAASETPEAQTAPSEIVASENTQDENAGQSQSSQTEDAQNENSRSGYSQPVFTQTDGGVNNIAPRSVGLCILFSIITCGIYGIYWMIKMNDEVNTLSGEENATSGGMVFLFSIITCGIYGLYWLYKMGERIDRMNNAASGDSRILYLLLGIFGLGIVSYCLIQSEINKAVGASN